MYFCKGPGEAIPREYYDPRPPLRDLSALISWRKATRRAFKLSSRAWLSFMLAKAAYEKEQSSTPRDLEGVQAPRAL